MYATVGTRPDLAFVVGKLSQFCHDPAVRHRKASDRRMRYLKGTADLALVYDHNTPNDPSATQVRPMETTSLIENQLTAIVY